MAKFKYKKHYPKEITDDDLVKMIGHMRYLIKRNKMNIIGYSEQQKLFPMNMAHRILVRHTLKNFTFSKFSVFDLYLYTINYFKTNKTSNKVV